MAAEPACPVPAGSMPGHAWPVRLPTGEEDHVVILN